MVGTFEAFAIERLSFVIPRARLGEKESPGPSFTPIKVRPIGPVIKRGFFVGFFKKSLIRGINPRDSKDRGHCCKG